MIGLASLSVGYALWSKTLTITGTVNTGNVDAEWSLHNPWYWDEQLGYDTDDGGTLGVTPPCTEGSDPGCKNVSDIKCVITGDTLNVTITNAYPSIDYYCNIDVTSTGTVPIHLENVTLTKPTAGVDPDHFDFEIVDDPDQGDNTTAYSGALGDWLICEQLHINDSAYGILHVHFDNESGIMPGDVVTFSGTVLLVQWNESECATCAGNNTPTVDVYIPSGGEVFYVDEEILIEWTMTDADGIAPAGSTLPSGPLTVDIDLDSRSGADNFPCHLDTLVYEAASPDDIYQSYWLIPEDVSPYCPGLPPDYHISSHIQIRVTVTDPCGATTVDATPDFCPIEGEPFPPEP